MGCYGDGGALFTQDLDLSEKLKSLRSHGKGSQKYDNVRVGINSRLDTLQAAILLEKLALYSDEIEKRNQVAARYTKALEKTLQTPTVPAQYQSIWAQYTVRANNFRHRADCMATLKADLNTIYDILSNAITLAERLQRFPSGSKRPSKF